MNGWPSWKEDFCQRVTLAFLVTNGYRWSKVGIPGYKAAACGHAMTFLVTRHLLMGKGWHS